MLMGALVCAAVLFAPLTCVELRGARTEKRDDDRSEMIVLDMSLSVNLMAPTIEKVVAKLKASHLDLLRLFELDFKANGVPDAALSELQGLMKNAEAKDGVWFNEAEQFQKATAKAFGARDGVLRWMVAVQRLAAPWPRVYAALGTSLDAALEPTIKELAQQEKLSVGSKVIAYNGRMRRWDRNCVINGTVPPATRLERTALRR